jgi:hypothetical protein
MSSGNVSIALPACWRSFLLHCISVELSLSTSGIPFTALGQPEPDVQGAPPPLHAPSNSLPDHLLGADGVIKGWAQLLFHLGAACSDVHSWGFRMPTPGAPACPPLGTTVETE